MTKNLFELKKAHWRTVKADKDRELIVAKNGNHAIARNGNKYLEWDFDILPDGTTTKGRNKDEEFKLWMIDVEKFMTSTEEVNA